MDKAEDEEVDFYFSSSAVQSCMATEYDSQALVTIVNRREARGHTYELDKYGGVMFTLASNEQINTIEDLKDKTIGAGGEYSRQPHANDSAMTRTKPYLLFDCRHHRNGSRADAIPCNVSSRTLLRGRSQAGSLHHG